MNVISLLNLEEKNLMAVKAPAKFPIGSLSDRYDVEVKIPQDIHNLLKRISTTIDKNTNLSKNSSLLGRPETITAPFKIGTLIADVKNTSYRIGWLDGQGELRRKFMLNLKSQFTKKEEDYQNKIMKLSLLLNSKNMQIAELEQENYKYQELVRILHKEKDALKNSLQKARQDRDRFLEFFEVSRAKESMLRHRLAIITTELEVARRKKWWEFWK